jgi:hypothetical protein
MKATLVLFLFAASAFAQDPAAVMAAKAACGPSSVKFDAQQDASQHPTPEPDPGKAMVYVVQSLGEIECASCTLTRVALDGAWVGATQGTSYLFFPVDPGEHHLCVNWQSRFEWKSKALALANFTAEPGHVYYFRVRLSLSRLIYVFDLDPINNDQGKLLVASSGLSVSHPKK